MGRDVAGFHAERKTNNVFNTKGKITENEHSPQKEDVVDLNNTNYVTGSLDPKALKPESINLEEKKHIKPAATPASLSIARDPLQSSSNFPDSSPLANNKEQSKTTNTAGIMDVKSPNSHSSANTEIPQEIYPFVPKENVLHDDNQYHYNEDDNMSLASSNATSVRSDKFKTTIPIAPKFVCNDRLSKRREFYAKLEEKQKALEAERLEAAARQKEEEEAAIKELRKSMVPKVNPVPSFYREGPPPKTELKKFPVTRAKSPKLTRRKSYGDSMKSTHEEKETCERIKRHNVGVHKESNNTTPLTNKAKNSLSKSLVTEGGRSKDHDTKKVIKKEMSTKVKGVTNSTHQKGMNKEEYVADDSVIQETMSSTTTAKKQQHVGTYITDVDTAVPVNF